MRNINTVNISPEELKAIFSELRAGETIYLTSYVYTARDAAHKKIRKLIKNGEELPFPLKGSMIYYAGPTPAKKSMVIGSCGPTTSSRMDIYTPELYSLGLLATIGKGERSEEVMDSCRDNGSVYFCAIGGAGALAAKCITENTVIAFPELGCESVKRLRFEKFPLTVGVDTLGNSIFSRERLK